MCRSVAEGQRRCDSTQHGKTLRKLRYTQSRAADALADQNGERFMHYVQASAGHHEDLECHDSPATPDTLPRDQWVPAAQLLATQAHEGQYRRDGKPYITHPEGVAVRLQRAGLPDDVVAAGWLHDTVEDTDLTLKDLRAAGFPSSTVQAVANVTHENGEDYVTETMPRALRSLDSATVKDADNQHNTSDRFGPTPAEYAKQVKRDRKYLEARRQIKARLYTTPDGLREVERIFAEADTRRKEPA